MTFNLHTFTIVHVVISLIGIGSGLIVLLGKRWLRLSPSHRFCSRKSAR
jgi:hypothetical protein